MTDLGKLEEKFHEFLKTGLNDKVYNVDLVKVTEDLFGQMKAFYIAFGFISYFLVNKNENPVLYVNIATRMDTDLILFIDEESYDVYDVFMGENEEISKKYYEEYKKVKRFEDMENIRIIKEKDKVEIKWKALEMEFLDI